MNLQNLVKYYLSCYQEDNQGSIITNIFKKSIEETYFFEGKDQIINNFLPYTPIIEEYAVDTGKKISLTKKEKELVYCSVFIVGKNNDPTYGDGKICAPLFIYPAEIINIEEDYFIKIDHDHRRINFGIFRNIIENDKLSDFTEEIYDIVGTGPIELSALNRVAQLFTKYTDNFDTSELLIFPEILGKKTVQSLFRRKAIVEEEKFMLIPASALGIIKKSVNTRGIINELNEISKNNDFSSPLQTIFNNIDFAESQVESISTLLPAILSREQEQIILNSSKYPFNVIIGPPGTGKSYTISCLAIEKMIKGKSVLIVSGTDKAVDIIADKIENQLNLNDIIVRGGRKEYRELMINNVQNILKINVHSNDEDEIAILSEKINALNEKINNLEIILNDLLELEIKRGQIFTDDGKIKFLRKIQRKIHSLKIKKNTPYWQIEEEIQKSYIKRNELNTKFIEIIYDKNLRELVKSDRNTVKNLLKALKSRIGTVQAEYFENLNYQTIFRIFPIWLVKMSDIYKILPNVKEIFDYVIIDEATQSNIAQAIPVLQRAKKAIITGDPKQLRHFSFLSGVKQIIFRDKYQLNNIEKYITDYRNNSLLDILSQSTKYNQQFTTLYEHYRSLPAIIDFSNKNFYDGKLKIMTNKPGLDNNKGIETIFCNGKRDKNGYNEKEANEILKKVKEIIYNEKKFDEKICSSIGILSPFRDQVEFISKQIMESFSYKEIEKHQICINTAYGFQGDEKDIMFLSFVVDKDTNATAYRYMSKPDVFNVTITRARKMQYIYYSVKPEDFRTDSYLRRYIESFQLDKHSETKQNINDKFLIELKQELEKRNFEIWESYEIAGLNIDMVVKKGEKSFGIDLIGYPGQFKDAFTLERYKMLTRAGLDIFPLPYSYWVIDREFCLSEIEKIT